LFFKRDSSLTILKYNSFFSFKQAIKDSWHLSNFSWHLSNFSLSFFNSFFSSSVFDSNFLFSSVNSALTSEILFSKFSLSFSI